MIKRNKKAFIYSTLLFIIMVISGIFLIVFGPEYILYFFSGYGMGSLITEIVTTLYIHILKKENDING